MAIETEGRLSRFIETGENTKNEHGESLFEAILEQKTITQDTVQTNNRLQHTTTSFAARGGGVSADLKPRAQGVSRVLVGFGMMGAGALIGLAGAAFAAVEPGVGLAAVGAGFALLLAGLTSILSSH